MPPSGKVSRWLVCGKWTMETGNPTGHNGGDVAEETVAREEQA